MHRGAEAGARPGGPDGRPRNIAAKEWDGYAQFWRGKDSRTVNNEVRALFLRTILGVCGVRGLVLSDENGNIRTHDMDGATSRCAVGLKIVLPDADFRRLARTDWSRFDFEAFLRAGDEGGTDEQIAQIPEPFRLHAKITASAHFELDAERNAAQDGNVQARP